MMARFHGSGAVHGEQVSRILLVCSPGGHLLQLLSMEPAYRDYEQSWVTLRGADSEYLLAGRDVVFAHGPTNRSPRMALRNVGVAWRTLRSRKPDVVLSTGAALAVPCFLMGRLLGCRVVYVESLTRTSRLSLSGRLVYPLAHAFFVQWPTTTRLRRAVYAGSIL
jgi:beta-1,4-N-acetylglucosaminyltransferase